MVEQVQETAKMISEMGIMVTICAFFLVGTIITHISNYKSQKRDREESRRLFEGLISDNKEFMRKLMEATNKQNDMLNDISEGLRPETKDRLKAVISTYFDLAVEKVARMYKRLKKENHIDMLEETHDKVTRLITNLHRNRNGQFANFTWRGTKINRSVNPEWVPMVVEVVKKELYDKDPNEERTYSNIKNIYDTIKNDYYERLGLE